MKKFIAFLGAVGSACLGYTMAASVYGNEPREKLQITTVVGLVSLATAFGFDEDRRLGWVGLGLAVVAYFVFGNVFQS